MCRNPSRLRSAAIVALIGNHHRHTAYRRHRRGHLSTKYTLQVRVAGRVDEIPVTKGELSLGRRPDNAVILDDPQVSGRHARRLCRSRTGKFKCV